MGWNRSDLGVELGGLLIGAHQHVDHQGQSRQGGDEADDVQVAGKHIAELLIIRPTR